MFHVKHGGKAANPSGTIKDERGSTMRGKRTWIAILLSVLLVLPLLQGCRQKTPEEIFDEAVAGMAKLESVHMDVNMTMEMTIMGQTLNMDMGIASDIMMKEPVMGYMLVTVAAGGMSMEVPTYVEQSDDAFMTYVGMDDGSGLVWTRQKAESMPIDSNMVSADALTEFTYIEEESAEDENLLRYRGTVDATQLKSLMNSSADGLGMLYGDEDAMLNAALEAVGGVEMIVTVDKKSGHIVRMEMDMGEMMQAFFKTLSDDAGTSGMDLSSLLKIGQIPVVVEYSRFNEIEKIEIPAEALEAELIEEDIAADAA